MAIQAKKIQEDFGINKTRYQYLYDKIGIKPDEEEVEGTGRAHRFSFRNLVQFAISNWATSMGWSGRSVKRLLIYFDEYEKDCAAGVFDSEKEHENLHAYKIYYPGVNYYLIMDMGEGGKARIYPEMPNPTNALRLDEFKKAESEMLPDGKSFMDWLADAEGYNTIDVGKIKKRYCIG